MTIAIQHDNIVLQLDYEKDGVLQMSGKTTSIRLNESLLSEIGARSNGNVNQYIAKCLENAVAFNPDFINRMDNFSKKIKAPLAEIVQGIVDRRIAEAEAEALIYGDGIYDSKITPIIELLSSDGSDFIYEALLQIEVEKLEKKAVAHGLKLEVYGGSPSEYEKRLMIKYRQGKAWEESEEHKKEVEMDRYIKEKYPELEELNKDEDPEE